ncbi:MAG: translation initiation factor IF-3 [Candidatus Kapaibacteriota bacterium]|jgi:translation initiation factor IF-3
MPRPELQRKHKINEEITASELRVVDEEGGQMGVLSRRDALQAARDREMDLVLIAPQAVPPVCKIIDYGKFSYEQQKREKAQKKAQHQKELKEIRLRAGTDTHDLDFKTRHAKEFLEQGHKVKATVFFRGREIVHQDLGRELLQKFIDGLVEVSKVDQDMRTEGRVLSVTLAPDVKKEKKKDKPQRPVEPTGDSQ